MEREASLLHALVADGLSSLLPLLHQHAASAANGRRSILLQYAPGRKALKGTSAFGIDRLPPDDWPSDRLPETLFTDGQPRFVAEIGQIFPGWRAWLPLTSAVLVPLLRVEDALGVLVVEAPAVPSAEQLRQLAATGDAFVLALDRARIGAAMDLQHQLRALLQEFSQSVSSSTLAAGLEAVCAGANRLFGADRTSVWLHERRTRTIVLSASSDVMYAAVERRVSTSDASAPAAVALRHERAELVAPVGTSMSQTGMVTVPLKGKRRALGTLIMEGVRLESGSEIELLDRAGQMGRELSAAVENVMLLDAVLRSRRELENTFNSLTDLVAVTDQEGRLVHTNRAFLDRSSRMAHELLNRPLAELVGGATGELIARARRDPATNTAELADPVLDGTFVFTLTPLIGDERQSLGVVFVARDITRHARLEEERAELRNRLLQSEKLAALGQFVAGIAHELNNPLQGVLGHLELLRATGAFPKALRRDMQRIYREADRAAKIVRNLLVFAGSRRLVRRRTSMNATLSRVLALRSPALRAGNIEVIRSHEDGLPRVIGDPLLLQQALLNVLLNAEQAIGGEGGRIETHTCVRQRDGARFVVVQIRDTGPGVPAAALPRLFEPFYTTKEVGKGTGLGLAITYGIIQEHGGHIVASNHPEGGAVFTVELPAESG